MGASWSQFSRMLSFASDSTFARIRRDATSSTDRFPSPEHCRRRSTTPGSPYSAAVRWSSATRWATRGRCRLRQRREALNTTDTRIWITQLGLMAIVKTKDFCKQYVANKIVSFIPMIFVFTLLHLLTFFMLLTHTSYFYLMSFTMRPYRTIVNL